MLRDRVIKLAQENPELRKHLFPLIRQAAAPPNLEQGVSKMLADVLKSLQEFLQAFPPPAESVTILPSKEGERTRQLQEQAAKAQAQLELEQGLMKDKRDWERQLMLEQKRWLWKDDEIIGKLKELTWTGPGGGAFTRVYQVELHWEAMPLARPDRNGNDMVEAIQGALNRTFGKDVLLVKVIEEDGFITITRNQ